jgi:hypothetical protein
VLPEFEVSPADAFQSLRGSAETPYRLMPPATDFTQGDNFVPATEDFPEPVSDIYRGQKRQQSGSTSCSIVIDITSFPWEGRSEPDTRQRGCQAILPRLLHASPRLALLQATVKMTMTPAVPSVGSQSYQGSGESSDSFFGLRGDTIRE